MSPRGDRAPGEEAARHDPRRAAWRRHRQEGRRHREPAQGPGEDGRRRGLAEHRRDPQAGDRRDAGGREHRPAAGAPGGLPPRDEARGAVGHAPRRRRASGSTAAAASAAPRSPGWSGTARAACRCTRCARTSITASATAKTTYGTCGVKVWIFKGEILAHDPMAQDRARRRAGAAALRDRREMLQPKRTKFRKAHKGRIHGMAKGGIDAELRRLRPEGAGAGAGDRPPDRGGPPRDHPRHEARRAASGSASSRTCRSRRSRPRCAWAPARARRSSGSRRVKPGRIMFEIDGVSPDDGARRR